MGEPPDEKRIVIADDDDLLVQLIKHKFEQHAIKVDTTSDGERALELVRELRPDAVILDGMMPGIDGFEVLQAIKEDPEIKDIPVVILSARQQEKDILGGLSLGAADYVVKPFMPDELYLRVARLLNQPPRT
ncbi:MAG: response regulator [Rhodospirillales bacterium]|jgi:DNA-binding response OmpR family regulator|nr:response regulator [Rhodospirillales bacterium]